MGEFVMTAVASGFGWLHAPQSESIRAGQVVVTSRAGLGLVGFTFEENLLHLLLGLLPSAKSRTAMAERAILGNHCSLGAYVVAIVATKAARSALGMTKMIRVAMPIGLHLGELSFVEHVRE